MNNHITSGLRRVCYLQKCNYRTRNSRKIVRGDVGIQGRLKLLKEGSPDIVHDHEEVLENMESDVTNLPELSAKFKRDISRLNKITEYNRIERKYFGKVKFPNMLTWAEKEQIRLLHQREPDVWTLEKLSQSFPATKSVLQKIVSSKWQLRGPEKIQKHDEAVVTNWKAFREGKLTIPDEDLEKHLKTFSARERILPPVQDLCKSLTKEIIEEPTKTGEFGQIIEAYKKKNSFDKETEEFQSEKRHIDPKLKNLKSSNVGKRNSLYTLEELRKTVKSNLSKNSEKTTSLDLAFIQGTSTGSKDKIKSITPLEDEEMIKEKLKETRVTSRKVVNRLDSYENEYPDWINIPKDKCKGAAGLYRVRDCFYDEDGEFLYRVPGMKDK